MVSQASLSLYLYVFVNLQIVRTVRNKCPETPLVLYINGNGGLLERMKGIGVDVIGLDWTVDMADGRKRLGSGISVQGNVDPAYLFSPLPALTEEIQRFAMDVL